MTTDPLSATFAALADPTRRAMLARLALKDMNVSELAEPFAMSLPAISKHLKVLEQAGLVSRGKEAQWRPCRLEPQGLLPVDEWLAHYRALWEARFDRLENYLAELQTQSPKAQSPKTQVPEGQSPKTHPSETQPSRQEKKRGRRN